MVPRPLPFSVYTLMIPPIEGGQAHEYDKDDERPVL